MVGGTWDCAQRAIPRAPLALAIALEVYGRHAGVVWLRCMLSARGGRQPRRSTVQKRSTQQLVGAVRGSRRLPLTGFDHGDSGSSSVLCGTHLGD